MRRTIPERESLTVEFKSDRKLDYSSLPVKDASECRSVLGEAHTMSPGDHYDRGQTKLWPRS